MVKALRILVVEDNPDDALVIERSLKRRGHEVVFAESGREGIETAISGRHELVIMDYLLGDMTGTEALLKIREKRQDVPVIMVSGMGGEFIVARALALGANGFVSKDEREFGERIAESIDSMSGDGGPLRPVVDRTSLEARAAEIKSVLRTLLQTSQDITSVGVVGPTGSLMQSNIKQRPGSQDVTAVLANTVQQMLMTIAGQLGIGKAKSFVGTFERGAVALAPLPGGRVLFLTCSNAAAVERLRKDAESGALELGSIIQARKLAGAPTAEKGHGPTEPGSGSAG